jgi:hypothetical protein
MINRRTLIIASAAALAGAPALAQDLAVLAPLDATGPITYYVAEGIEGSQYRESDRDLAVWALEAWARSAGGALRFEPASESEALIRVFWVPASAGQYGEMRAIDVDGRRGAAVYIRPDTEALGPDIARLAREDALLRETVVYLTCLHEIGHALGLGHTADFNDIMYFFGFGGDIGRFFMRYRELLETRDDIAGHDGVSPGDIAQLEALYGLRSASAAGLWR